MWMTRSGGGYGELENSAGEGGSATVEPFIWGNVVPQVNAHCSGTAVGSASSRSDPINQKDSNVFGNDRGIISFSDEKHCFHSVCYAIAFPAARRSPQLVREELNV